MAGTSWHRVQLQIPSNNELPEDTRKSNFVPHAQFAMWLQWSCRNRKRKNCLDGVGTMGQQITSNDVSDPESLCMYAFSHLFGSDLGAAAF